MNFKTQDLRRLLALTAMTSAAALASADLTPTAWANEPAAQGAAESAAPQAAPSPAPKSGKKTKAAKGKKKAKAGAESKCGEGSCG